MPAFTSFLNLYKPGGGSSGLILPDEVVDIDRINANMDVIDAFASGWGQPASRNHQFYGPAASLAGISGMKRGDTYQESDGNFVLWKYDGSNWITNENGVYILRPTTIVGGTVDASGAIIPTGGGASLTIDFGSFARFRTVRIVHYVEFTTNGSLTIAFRRGGSTLSAAGSYKNQRLRSNGVTVAADLANNAAIDMAVASQPVASGDLTVYNPGEAATFKSWTGNFYNGPTNPMTYQSSGLKDDSEVLAAIDGFAVVNSGTFKIGAKNFFKVYGLA